MNESEILLKKAARFREAILEVACGPGGMIISFPRKDTRRPFQEGDFPKGWCDNFGYSAWSGYTYTPSPTLAESWYGENTLWVTGMFLWSQMLRYKATGEPEALETARKCFLDLHNMFRLSGMIEPGCLGKPHGGRPGVTTSFDQAAIPVLFYAWYARDYATGDLKEQAYENLRQHGLWFLRHNMIVNQHGHLSNCVGEPHLSSMKYLASMYVSYELTGEKDVRDTVVTYLKKIVDAGILPFMSDVIGINHNLHYWSLLCEYWASTDLADMTDWISNIKDYWSVAKSAFDDQGLMRLGNYDVKSKKFTSMGPGWVYTDTETPVWKDGKFEVQRARHWVSYTAAGNSVGAGYLGLMAQSHGFDDDAHIIAKKTLLRLEENEFGWMWEEDNFPEELKPLLNIYGPEGLAIWLATYWYGKLQGAW